MGLKIHETYFTYPKGSKTSFQKIAFSMYGRVLWDNPCPYFKTPVKFGCSLLPQRKETFYQKLKGGGGRAETMRYFFLSNKLCILYCTVHTHRYNIVVGRIKSCLSNVLNILINLHRTVTLLCQHHHMLSSLFFVASLNFYPKIGGIYISYVHYRLRYKL